MLPIVKQLQSEGWQLAETHYCAAANPLMDYHHTWPKKPTHILSYGMPDGIELPQCNRSCPFRFDDPDRSAYHRTAIRIDHKSVQGQTRVEGYLRAAIPQGLFQIFDRAHQYWLCERLDRTAPRKRVAACYESHGSSAKVAMLVCKCCQHFDVNNNTVLDKHDDSLRHTRLHDMTPSQKWWLLMHARYGHAGYKRMRSLLRHRNMPNIKFGDMICKACDESKACRKAHTGKLSQASYAMQLVHVDLQGPFQVPDLDGNNYQAILVDDFTKRKWSLILRTKDEFGPKLKEWLASLHIPPETMRSDFGGEFLGKCTNDFLQTCAERGIHPEKSLPHESQQNGKAERANRLVLEMARTMLLAAGLPKTCWSYAIRHATYIDQFLDDTKTGLSPYEKWYGRWDDPDIRAFGSRVTFTHDDDRKKLDSPGHEGIFLGYVPESDGIFVWDQDAEHKPVRMTRNYKGKSFHEHCTVVTEPIGVTADEYELLHDEVKNLERNSYMTQDSEPMLTTDTTFVPEHTLKYWRSYQAFARDMRVKLSGEDLTPNEQEMKIRELWMQSQLRASQAEHDRLIDGARYRQAQEEAQRNIDSCGGESAEIPSTEVHAETVPPDGVTPVPSKDAIRGRPKATQPDPARPGTRRSARSKPINVTAESVPEAPNKPTPEHCEQDEECQVCKSKECNQTDKVMLLCSGCDKGFHQKCLSMRRKPGKHDDWFCHECCTPGTEIEIYRKRARNTLAGWQSAHIITNYKNGTCDVRMTDGAALLHMNLNYYRWRPVKVVNLAHIVAAMNLLPHSEEVESDRCTRMLHHVLQQIEPKSYNKITKLPQQEREKWTASMDKEWNSIIDKGVFDLIDADTVPFNADLVPTQWVYKIKSDGRYKSRVVACGNRQLKEELDIYSPTPRLSTVRVLLQQAVENDWAADVTDCSVAFLNSRLHKPIYCHLPPGRQEPGAKKQVMRCQKALYGAREAPR